MKKTLKMQLLKDEWLQYKLKELKNKQEFSRKHYVAKFTDTVPKTESYSDSQMKQSTPYSSSIPGEVTGIHWTITYMYLVGTEPV